MKYSADVLDSIRWNEEGLVVVVAQDYNTGEVRMVAWANREALLKTLETGFAHYYSRSRRSLWKKGETSGQLQRVLQVRVDCDGDAVLYIIHQEQGVACHTGERNCFFRSIDGSKVTKPLPFEVLARLQEVIEDRLLKKPQDSYTVKIYMEGEDRILQKLGEEAVESLLALKGGDPQRIKEELSDLLYFMVLSLTTKGVSVAEVMEELSRRFKTSE
ncbi:phosphoribosyl-ATP diphosphatase [Thermocrinis albus DSM 14484]|uniref:Histidine biosynthesis bifunctional protein HisIE n=1 Tax=Thermocrinis albus (strain DSM 14484 / JCM 11386 / HI 11/12) TaxID=638303 RepID=D3SN13_THEAH|nr:bifunctional phosphoribosyl-AMP cyclohydrolase/phosphoribosyl-ATP diphosphatase HisIE [Thermocrinis albus]ADC90143.1 phosphoribosyl-ATP diphosphatase [Thermocrinis albus DSM 14484]